MPMGKALAKTIMELLHVQPERLPGRSSGRGSLNIQADSLPVSDQPIPGEGFFEGREGPTEGG
jgi:hypothetical protein